MRNGKLFNRRMANYLVSFYEFIHDASWKHHMLTAAYFLITRQDDLKKFATTWKKEYIDIVPYLIVAFKQTYGVNEDGSKDTHYYFERCG